MFRRLSAGAALSLLCFSGCSDGTTPPTMSSSGSAGMSSSGGTASSMAGTSSSMAGSSSGGSGNVGGTSTTAGTGGQSNQSGSGGSGGSAGSAAGSGGATGGTGGAAGAAGGGMGGGGGSGGSGSTLPKKVLFYSFSTYNIPGVDKQIALFKAQLTNWGYDSEESVKPDDINAQNLQRFGAVAMINTCFYPFGQNMNGDSQTQALKAFVEAGGGLFGTHCAAVTFQSANPPNAYNVLIGGRGGSMNNDGMSTCTTMGTHPTIAMLPATFTFNGNLDNPDYIADDTQVLVKCKWAGGAMKEPAVSWVRTQGKGRVFYTNFAKVDADISDATLGQKHIIPGLSWVLGR